MDDGARGTNSSGIGTRVIGFDYEDFTLGDLVSSKEQLAVALLSNAYKIEIDRVISKMSLSEISERGNIEDQYGFMHIETLSQNCLKEIEKAHEIWREEKEIEAEQEIDL